mgnify:FL=1
MKTSRQVARRDYYLRNRERILAKVADYRAAHPESVAEARKRAVAKNPEKYLAMGRRHYHKDIEASRAQGRSDYQRRKETPVAIQYREAHLQDARDRAKAWRLAHTERDKQNHLRWRLKHPGLFRAIQARHEAKTRGGEGKLTSDQWEAIKIAYQNRCAYCGIGKTRLERDHVVPLALGGQHVAANIVPACRKCNATKGRKAIPNVPMVRLLV